MTDDDDGVLNLDGSDGELLIHTGVVGPAAAVGHRLTIAMRQWRVRARWESGEPVDAELTVDVGSLDVVRGEGGVMSLSGLEKILVRRNALSSLNAPAFPRITFCAKAIDKTDTGYRLIGDVTIHGRTGPQIVDVRTDDQGETWRLCSETVITQSAFGLQPYSQLLGAVKVADDVTVRFAASAPKTFGAAT